MMRFQLDPRGQPVERRMPPPLTPPAAPAQAQPEPSLMTPTPSASSTPPTPRPGASATPSASSAGAALRAPVALPRPRPAAAPARRKLDARRLRLYAILAVVLLLGAGTATAALYVAEMPPFEYPRRYMLEGDELPRGMRMGTLPPDLADELGIEENPGQVDPDELSRMGEGGVAPTPEEGWAEVLAPTAAAETPVIVLALRFEDEDDARRWTSLVSLRCSSVGGAVLRDGDVAVVVAGEGTAAQAYAGRVVDSLRSEAPGLSVVCRSGR